MTYFQFCLILLAGPPAIICLAYLLYLLLIMFEDSSEKKWLKQIENSSFRLPIEELDVYWGKAKNMSE